MAEETQASQNIQANNDSVAVGSLSVGGSVDGSLIIGSHNVVGFTSDQVSTLIAQISTTFQPKPFDGRSPYKGLDVFEEEDAELFFGREKLVEDLVGKVRQSRTLFVTGPSGSGKSSLVRAGLIHALKQRAGKELTSDRWLYATLKPGRDPIEALASAFSRLKDPGLGKYLRENASQASALHECAESVLTERKDQRLVLFIDQFEEVFTQLSKDKAQTFIDLLAHAADVENGRVITLFSMRSDFISNCATFPQLNALLNQQFVQIGAMQPEELVSAIAQPALRVGLRIDPDLIAQTINDMRGEPGSLPLMQFALKDLFDSQQAKGKLVELKLTDYLERGGIRKALERHADNSFNKLDGHEQELARSIFTGLIEVGRGTQDTRRTAILDELIPANAKTEEVEAILRKLADARLITTDEVGGKDTVTISHEKLIEAWPWLKRLVNENRNVIALQNEIAADAKEWEEHKRDSSYLYSGARLVNAHEQLKSNKLVLSGTALEYIRAGQARQRQSRLALISAISAVIVLLILAVIIFSRQSVLNAQTASFAQTAEANAQAASTEALNQKNNAEQQRQIAELQKQIAFTRQLAAQAMSNLDANYDLAELLSVEANNRLDIIDARNALLSGIQRHSNLIGSLQGHHSPIVALVFNPKKNMLASAGKDGQIILWDLDQRIALSDPLVTDRSISSLSFSPDGQVLAAEMIGTSEVEIQWKEWNVLNLVNPTTTNTQPTWCVDQCPQNVYQFQPSPISDLAASPNGKLVVSSNTDKTLTFWDIAETPDWNNTDYSHNQHLTIPWYIFINRVVWSADSKVVAAGDEEGRILLWAPPVFPPQLKPSENNFAWGIDVSRFTPVDWTLAKSDGLGFAFAKATDGLRIDPTLKENWNTLKKLGIPRGTYAIYDPNLDPKQQALVLVNQAPLLPGDLPPALDLEMIRRAEVQTNEDLLANMNVWITEVERKTGRRPILYNAAGLLQQSTRDRTGEYPVWLTRLPFWLAEYPSANTPSHKYEDPHAGPVNFSPSMPSGWPSDWSFWQFTDRAFVKGAAFDGQPTYVDVSYYRGTAADLDKALRQVPFPMSVHENPAQDLNSRRIAQALPGQPGAVSTVEYSHSGAWLASGSTDGKLILWDMRTGSISAILQPEGNFIHSLSISPDEQWLATGLENGTVQIWNLKTHQIRSEFPVSQRGINSVAFSHDSQTLVAGGCAEFTDASCSLGQLTIWNMKDLKMRQVSGHEDEINSIMFSPDDKLLASGGEDGNIIFWQTTNWKKDGASLKGSSSILKVLFSHNGKWLASSGLDGSISLWDISSRRMSGQPLTGHTEPVFGLSFNQDDSVLASSSWDNTIVLWDTNSRQRVGDPLRGHTDYVYSVAFSPDGDSLVSGSWDNTILRWDLRLQTWKNLACQLAGRNMSSSEWDIYFPDTPYPTKQEEATCPQWPLQPKITSTP